jgi:hypothetical protein
VKLDPRKVSASAAAGFDVAGYRCAGKRDSAQEKTSDDVHGTDA